MEFLRAGSLNINGGRDGNKMAMVSELFTIKKVVLFLFFCLFVFYKRRIPIQIMIRNGKDGGKGNVC